MANEVSGLEAHIGYWLRFVSNSVSQAFARRLVASGVTVAEWVMLREMFDVVELAPSELAERTGLTRGAVSKLVERLVEKKLVRRDAADDDGRSQRVALTGAGRRVVPKLAALADENDEEFFAALGKTESEVLRALMKKLVRANGLHTKPTE
jgi:DNA-binding MarR family transcriptional regulator